MAQGWSSPGSSMKSERSAIRPDSPALERDNTAGATCQTHLPAWLGLAGPELVQQQHPGLTEEHLLRYAASQHVYDSSLLSLM